MTFTNRIVGSDCPSAEPSWQTSAAEDLKQTESLFTPKIARHFSPLAVRLRKSQIEHFPSGMPPIAAGAGRYRRRRNGPVEVIPMPFQASYVCNFQVRNTK